MRQPRRPSAQEAITTKRARAWGDALRLWARPIGASVAFLLALVALSAIGRAAAKRDERTRVGPGGLGAPALTASARLPAAALAAPKSRDPCPRASTGSVDTAGGRVDINRATIDELVRLPGIGRRRASAIVLLREKRRGFKHVRELLRIRGIGRRSLERMKPMVEVGPYPPPTAVPDAGHPR